MTRNAGLVTGVAVAIGLLSVYVCLDIARAPVSQRNADATIGATVEPASLATAPVPIKKTGPSLPSSAGRAKGTAADEAIVPSELTTAERRERAQKRANRKIETLDAFFVSQPRDAWSAEKEIELRRKALPEGVRLDEVSCRSAVCRFVASGPDKMQLLETTSSVGEMKSFSRVVPGTEEAPQVVAYLSPSGTKWPRPTFDE